MLAKVLIYKMLESISYLRCWGKAISYNVLPERYFATRVE
jgi:hypothetical protein